MVETETSIYFIKSPFFQWNWLNLPIKNIPFDSYWDGLSTDINNSSILGWGKSSATLAKKFFLCPFLLIFCVFYAQFLFFVFIVFRVHLYPQSFRWHWTKSSFESWYAIVGSDDFRPEMLRKRFVILKAKEPSTTQLFADGINDSIPVTLVSKINHVPAGHQRWTKKVRRQPWKMSLHRAAMNWRRFLESRPIRLCSITCIKWILFTRSLASKFAHKNQLFRKCCRTFRPT
jgi:hypothetical protein